MRWGLPGKSRGRLLPSRVLPFLFVGVIAVEYSLAPVDIADHVIDHLHRCVGVDMTVVRQERGVSALPNGNDRSNRVPTIKGRLFLSIEIGFAKSILSETAH